jgi:hypothetical protein
MMNYAFNRIKFNRQAVSYIAKEGKKKYSNNNSHNKIIIRKYSQQMPNSDPNNNPFPSWKIIALFSGLGLYHQYKCNVNDNKSK